MLKLSPDLSLPDAYVTSTGALLAVRGAGKSNTAAVMAEEMFAQRLPFVVVDPVGAWWGLRSHGTTGTGTGLPIPIFGGKRGDVPLERGAGELVADTIVGQRLSCVLDLSTFHSEGDKKAFLLAFALRLYQKNEDPLHLFLEEADDYIPQKPMREEAHLLRAFENIVRRGRGRGLGITLITQRSAVLNKNVLTQTETLFAMRTTGPQDIKAIEAWVQYHQADKDILASLASLEDGEAWVWSPHFLKTVQRVKVRRRWTFDSGATPKNVKAGQARKVATLADVDLEALRGRMAETIEKAKADDPKELRRRIHELQQELKKANALTPGTVFVEPARVEVPVLTAEHFAQMSSALEAIDMARQGVLQAGQQFGTVASEVMAALLLSRQPPSATLRLPGVSPGSLLTVGARQTGKAIRTSGWSTTDGLDGAQQKILDVVAMLGVRGLTPNREMVARWLSIHPNGGRYGSNLAVLREQGYLSERGFELTGKGHQAARAMDTYLTDAKAPLDGAQQAIVDVLAADRRTRFTRESLAEALGIHPNGGRYGSNLARLRTMGLIPERGPIHLTEAADR